MKKFISVIISAILLFSCFGLAVFANGSSATLSEDYQKLTLEGHTYSRFDATTLATSYFSTLDTPVELSETQKETVNAVDLGANESKTVIYATIRFKDGAELTIDFLRDDYLETYNEMMTGQNSEYMIDFQWPEGNTVTAEKADLFGELVSLNQSELEWCDYFYVDVQSSDGSLASRKGALIIVDEKYYYVDYEEAGILDRYEFDPYALTELSVHEITDTDLMSSIQEAEEKYYEDDLGFLYDDTLTETISAVFLIFVFAIIPFAIFIVFLILAIRSKAVYRKLFSTICILSGAELALFTIITTFVIMVK